MDRTSRRQRRGERERRKDIASGRKPLAIGWKRARAREIPDEEGQEEAEHSHSHRTRSLPCLSCQIEKLDRVRQPPIGSNEPNDKLLIEMLWSDPRQEAGLGTSKRGAGVLFGPDVTQQVCLYLPLCLLFAAHPSPAPMPHSALALILPVCRSFIWPPPAPLASHAASSSHNLLLVPGKEQAAHGDS